MKRTFFHRFWLATVGLVATTMIFIAIVITVLRFLVPQIPEYKSELEIWLSAKLGYQVKIAEIDARMIGGRFVLQLIDAEILDNHRHNLLFELKDLTIIVNAFGVFESGGFEIEKVDMSGLDLIVERHSDNTFGIVGLPPLQSDLAQEGAPRDSAQLFKQIMSALPGRIRVSDSSLLFRDLVLNESYRATSIDIELINDSDHPALAGSLAIPEVLGNQLRFHLSLAPDFDPEAPSADLYLQGNRLMFQHWPWLKAVSALPNITGGNNDVQIWASLLQGKMISLQGRLASRNLVFKSNALGMDEVSLERFETDFSYDNDPNGWMIRTANLIVRREGKEWTSRKMQVWSEPHKDLVGQRIGLSFEYLRLEDIAAMVSLFPQVPPHVIDRLDQAAIAGDFNDGQIALEINNGVVGDYMIDISVDGISYGQGNKLISVKGLGGKLLASQTLGKLSINGSRGELLLASLFRTPIPFTDLSANLFWQFDESGWQLISRDITVNNDDLQLSGSLSLSMGEGNQMPVMDLRTHLKRFNANSVSRYLPSKIMSIETVNWLDKAFKNGVSDHTDVIFYGKLDNFPFRNSDGIFEVRSQLRDVTLNYQDGWPEITKVTGDMLFTGTGMDITIRSGAYEDVAVGPGSVRIPSFRRPLLTVKADINGPWMTQKDFILDSPLADKTSDLFQQLQVDGNSSIDLDLSIPLMSKLNKKMEVNVTSSYSENRFRLPDWNLALENISGEISFGDSGVKAGQLTGQLFEEPFLLQIKPRVINNKRLARVTVDASLNPLWYLNEEKIPFKRAVKGVSKWHFTADIPDGKNRDEITGLKITGETDMKGLQIDLPEPMYKADASSKRALSFDMVFDSHQAVSLSGKLGDNISTKLQFIGKDRQQLERGELRFGTGKARLPSTHGLKVVGRTGIIDVDAWWSWLKDVETDSPDKQSKPVPLNRIDLMIGKLRLAEHEYLNLGVDLRRESYGWLVKLNNPDIKGTARIPYPDFSSGTLDVNLEKFHFVPLEKSKNKSADSEADIDVAMPSAETLPNVRIVVDKLIYDEINLGEFSFSSTKIDKGIQVDRLNIEGSVINVMTNGSWLTLEGKEKTQLQGSFETSDIGRFLAGVGHPKLINSGSGKGSIDLSWSGNPMDFNYSTMKGIAEFTLEDGQLPSVEPGAGRIVGLLSINELIRRVFLDFSDFFVEGFAFDRIQGYMEAGGGNAFVKDFYIDGPSAFVELRGRIGMVNEDYDQIMTVTPKTSNTLPVIGGIAASPAVGLSILIFQKLFKNQLDSITQFKYKISGPWENPKMEKVVIKNQQEQPAELQYDADNPI